MPQTSPVAPLQGSLFPILVAALTLIGTLSITGRISQYENRRTTEQAKARVFDQLSTVRVALEGEINQRLFLTRGLEAYISAERPDIDQAEFSLLAEVILAEQTGIQSIVLYQDNVISHIYPFEENQAAIGFDPTGIPEERAAIDRAIETRQTVITGPIEQAEGTTLISRTPIFLTPAAGQPQRGEYWGLAGTIILEDVLLDEAGVLELTDSLQVSLRDAQGAGRAVFYGDPSVFDQEAITTTVSLPDGSWQLAAIPPGGWVMQSPLGRLIWIMGGAVALVSSVLMYQLVQAPQRLRFAIVEATTALAQSQEDLEAANQSLEAQVEQRTDLLKQMTEKAQQENEMLQYEIEQLLYVASEVEAGNLTVQANMSPLITGLLADTLNRLIEQLTRVMIQVIRAAQEVSFGTRNLEMMAADVARNADQQAQDVAQVLMLTQEVERVALDAAEKVDATNQFLMLAAGGVDQGQETITSLTDGIGILRQGSDRIVQQMKTLGEFVGLAEQFVTDQSSIAAMTQVLALNAALVAARASEQRDPRQFAVVAREFEAIADQVGALAQQTNESLTTLEQRTAQIHTVVSTIDTEVQGLSGLVSEFTQGVEQSSEIFKDVGDVTREVVKAGKDVSASTRNIIEATQATANTIEQIAQLAQQTALLTSQSQSQSEQMGALSGQLMAEVEFFRIPIDPEADQIREPQGGPITAVWHPNQSAPEPQPSEPSETASSPLADSEQALLATFQQALDQDPSQLILTQIQDSERDYETDVATVDQVLNDLSQLGPTDQDQQEADQLISDLSRVSVDQLIQDLEKAAVADATVNTQSDASQLADIVEQALEDQAAVEHLLDELEVVDPVLSEQQSLDEFSLMAASTPSVSVEDEILQAELAEVEPTLASPQPEQQQLQELAQAAIDSQNDSQNDHQSDSQSDHQTTNPSDSQTNDLTDSSIDGPINELNDLINQEVSESTSSHPPSAQLLDELKTMVIQDSEVAPDPQAQGEEDDLSDVEKALSEL